MYTIRDDPQDARYRIRRDCVVGIYNIKKTGVKYLRVPVFDCLCLRPIKVSDLRVGDITSLHQFLVS